MKMNKMNKAILLMLVMLAGCVSWVARPRQSHPPANGTLPAFFDQKRQLPDMINGNDGSFFFSSWRESGYPKNDMIKGKWHAPAQEKNQNNVFLILPPSGENFPAEIIAKKLASRGFLAVRIKAGFDPLPDGILEQAQKALSAQEAVDIAGGFFVNAMHQRTIDLMRLADFLKKKYPSLKEVHVVGISLGGVVGALYAVIDPRATSLVMLVSSASTARLIMDTNEKKIASLRKAIMDKFRLSYEEAYQLLANKIQPVEPLTYASRMDTQRMIMVSGLLDMLGIPFDSAIPLSASQETWRGFGKPEWAKLATGHVTSAIAFLPTPIWFELSHPHHLPPFYGFSSYFTHLFEKHYLPKIN